MEKYPGADLSPTVVPDVVGMVVDDAARRATAARLTLAQPDPDGPPLAALTWRTSARVTSQRPAAGTVLRGWESLVVTWDDGRGGVREPRRPTPRVVPDAAEIRRDGLRRGEPAPLATESGDRQ